MESTNHSIYRSKQNDNQIEFNQKYLVVATNDLLQLNSKWQRLIKEEKERKRNALTIEPMTNEFIEKNATDINELFGTIEDNASSGVRDNNDMLNFRHITPVSKINVPSEVTREQIAQQFTLNKNQKAAFLIITGHLDGLDKLNEGILIM